MSAGKLLQSVRERMRKARDLAADDMLSWEAVMAVIGAAAGKGHEVVSIAPKEPVNLKGTERALATVGRLEAAGFKARWESRRTGTDEPETFALVVSW